MSRANFRWCCYLRRVLGGFADGQGLAGALALGACGINMGTRFMCTVEAPIHENIKKSIVGASENDTEIVLRRWKNSNRYFKNKTTDDALKIERESTTGEFAEVLPYVSGQRGRQVFLNGKFRKHTDTALMRTRVPWTRLIIPSFISGDPEYGVWTAGLCIGLIKDVPTCQDLVARIEREALETISKQLSYVKDRARL